MVRGVLLDEAQLDVHLDGLYRNHVPVEVGLLIGRLAVASRDLIFALIPTPSKDGGGSGVAPVTATNAGHQQSSSGAGKKGAGKSKNVSPSNAPLVFDEEWIAEHARQVDRMLVGGLQVVGLYAFCGEGAFKSSIPGLWQALRAVAATTGLAPSFLGDSEGTTATGPSERLLLHASSEKRSKWACRSCALGMAFASAVQPCEVKLGKLLPSLHTLATTYEFDVELPITDRKRQESTATLRSAIAAAIAKEEERLRAAHAILDRQLASPGASLGPGSTRAAAHDVKLLVPMPWAGDRSASKASSRAIGSDGPRVLGTVHITGAVTARSYAYSRETVGRAIADLKADVIASLEARLDLLVDTAEASLEEDGDDDAEDDREGPASGGGETAGAAAEPDPHPLLATAGGGGGLSASWQCAMPRRVFVPWHEGVLLCDYMLPSESLEDVVDRCKDMLGLEVADGAETLIQQPEKAASLLKAKAASGGAEFASVDSKHRGTSLIGAGIWLGQGKVGRACLAFAFSGVGVALLAVAINLGYGGYSVSTA